MRSHISWCVVMVLCTTAFGCTRDAKPEVSVVPNQDIVVGVGHIAFLDLEGGFYAIESDDGVTYDPMSLPESFRIDGLRVRFTVRIMGGVFSIHQAGPIVEVLDISELV